MHRNVFTSASTALTACAAAALIACGGGNDDPNDNPLTVEQAKSLAASTIHAVLIADHMATLVTATSLGAWDTTRAAAANAASSAASSAAPSAASSATCMAGEGSFVSTDVDASDSLSAGDHISYSFKACQPTLAAGWVLDGDPVVSVAGGTNVQRMWFGGEDGQIALKLSGNGMRLGGGTSLAGDWQFDATRTAGTLSQAVRLDAVTFGSRDLTSQFDGIRFAVANNELHGLTGQVRTSVLGYGDVTAVLSQASMLLLDSTQTLRHAPTAGTVFIDTPAFRMAVVYGEAGAVLLQVDQGRDDTVDLEVTSSVQELDALLNAATSPGVAETPACADPDAGAGSAQAGSAICVRPTVGKRRS